MNRRTSLKLLGASGVGIAGLALANWKWQIVDRLSHEGFFSYDEERVIAAVADTFIPEGLPPMAADSDARPLGAISTGTDQFLIRLYEKCYEKEEQDLIRLQLKSLNEKGFTRMGQKEREQVLLEMKDSPQEAEGQFYQLMRSNTILGFTTVKEVMTQYGGYQVAPGFYQGCVDLHQA